MASTEGDDKGSKGKGEQGEKRSQVKRPMNAFMLWSKEKRRKISSVDPSLHNSHISKILGEEWKTLPMHEKDPYIKESKTLMERHKLEHPDYHYKPRQNKLTKALKELSSLHSSLKYPAAFQSGIKSDTLPRYMPEANHCAPCFGLERRAVRERDDDFEDVPYHVMPALYSAPLPYGGCTCKLQCSDSGRYLSPQLYRWRTRPGCKDFRLCYGERPTLLDRAWNLHSGPSPRYGWSVPVLVNVGCDSKEARNEMIRNDTETSNSSECNNGDDGYKGNELGTLASKVTEEQLCLRGQKK